MSKMGALILSISAYVFSTYEGQKFLNKTENKIRRRQNKKAPCVESTY